jgi:hypothetical protein
MIRVEYRPMADLSPLHQAILVAAKKSPSHSGLLGDLSISAILFEPALKDLQTWGYLASNKGKYSLLPPGMECVQVWRDTDKTGTWEVANPEGWLLGKGKFRISANSACLTDVGFNQDNGRQLTHKEAVALLDSHKKVGIPKESRGKPGPQSLGLATTQEILLAHWLHKQKGFLGEIAHRTPSSLLVESTFGFPPEPEPGSRATADGQEAVQPGSDCLEREAAKPQLSPESPSESMFQRLLGFFRPKK